MVPFTFTLRTGWPKFLVLEFRYIAGFYYPGLASLPGSLEVAVRLSSFTCTAVALERFSSYPLAYYITFLETKYSISVLPRSFYFAVVLSDSVFEMKLIILNYRTDFSRLLR